MPYDNEEDVEVSDDDNDDYVELPIRHCHRCGIIGYGDPCSNCGGTEGEDLGY